MIRIFMSGCMGRMGKVIDAIAKKSDDLKIVAGSDIASGEGADFPVYAKASDCREEFDVMIDFSSPQAMPELFKLMKKTGKPSIICTTGLSEEYKQELADLSRQQAVFISANMSLGINILIHLAKQAAKLLYPAEFDLEIVEAHHRYKVDAPSGTALMIAQAVNESLDNQLKYTYDRSQVRQQRSHDELGLHAVRGGSIVGEHSVIFAGNEETLTIQHSAQSRDVFAQGALAAARFLAGKPAGLYSMTDLVNDI